MTDLIDRQAAIGTAVKAAVDWHKLANPQYSIAYCIGEAMRGLQSAQPEIIRCKDCKWWDRRDEQLSYGYCHAIKHCHYSRHWEISIYRTYDKEFFCADAERRTDE